MVQSPHFDNWWLKVTFEPAEPVKICFPRHRIFVLRGTRQLSNQQIYNLILWIHVIDAICMSLTISSERIFFLCNLCKAKVNLLQNFLNGSKDDDEVHHQRGLGWKLLEGGPILLFYPSPPFFVTPYSHGPILPLAPSCPNKPFSSLPLFLSPLCPQCLSPPFLLPPLPLLSPSVLIGRSGGLRNERFVIDDYIYRAFINGVTMTFKGGPETLLIRLSLTSSETSSKWRPPWRELGKV